jgi:adenylate cyclase
MADVDFEAKGLLDGLENEADRDARRALLAQLHDAGVPVDELRRAVAEDRLALLPVELVLAGDQRYTAAEVAEKSGLDLDFFLRLQRAFGLPIPEPDEKGFGEAAVRAAQRAKRFRGAGMPADAMIEVGRVVGQSTSRLAEAIRSLVTQAVAPGAESERDLGLGFARVARELGPEMGPMLGDALTAHLLEQVRSDMISRAQVMATGGLPGAREVGVCFADLVGFTRLGERRPVDELGSVAERLATLTEDVARPPVRVVKMIGDAAMLVSPEVGPLLDSALELVEAAERQGEDFPQLRAGAAAGPAINRGGDWYGHTVNLASRLTGAARPGSVLVDESVKEAVDGGYRWSFAGQRKLKGINDPVKLYRARRDGAQAAT